MRSDLRLALRSLTRRPVVSPAIVLTIGGALAAAAVAFATVNGMLLRPLPCATPDRLVTPWERSLTRDVDRNTVSPANYLTWREEPGQVERLAAVSETSGSLTGADQPQQVGLVLAAGDFFDLLGATPVVGRLFGAAEAAEGGPDVIVMAERYWRTRFGADPSVVGRSVVVNGASREVILALSVVLLVGAGVLIRSLVNRLTVDLGFETGGVLTAQLNLPGSRYPTSERRALAIEGLLAGVAEVPEIEVATAASIIPMSDQGQATSFSPLDGPDRAVERATLYWDYRQTGVPAR